MSLRMIRYFSSATILRTAPASSCPAGTVLNLKVKKNGDEPVALEDSQYPPWLWTMLDRDLIDEELKAADIMKYRRRILRKANTKKITQANFLSKM